ncbi:MAG: hypothetical protein QOI75_2850, partial [Pseudonocardiales bacterium]|nr:hypothetical protein [Pseudonocardiales bacterium]
MTEPVVRTASELLARLRAAGVGRGGSVALALVDGVGLGVAADGGRWS